MTAGERVSDSLERPFAANGRISMDLSAGEYRITGADDDRIRLEWAVRDPEQLSSVKARAVGRKATVAPPATAAYASFLLFPASRGAARHRPGLEQGEIHSLG